jgi:glycine dehydrogenase
MKTELFLNRHLGPRKEEVDLMLQKIRVDSLETLIKETIPENIRLTQDMKLDDAMSESDYLMHLKRFHLKTRFSEPI